MTDVSSRPSSSPAASGPVVLAIDGPSANLPPISILEQLRVLHEYVQGPVRVVGFGSSVWFDEESQGKDDLSLYYLQRYSQGIGRMPPLLDHLKASRPRALVVLSTLKHPLHGDPPPYPVLFLATGPTVGATPYGCQLPIEASRFVSLPEILERMEQQPPRGQAFARIPVGATVRSPGELPPSRHEGLAALPEMGVACRTHLPREQGEALMAKCLKELVMALQSHRRFEDAARGLINVIDTLTLRGIPLSPQYVRELHRGAAKDPLRAQALLRLPGLPLEEDTLFSLWKAHPEMGFTGPAVVGHPSATLALWRRLAAQGPLPAETARALGHTAEARRDPEIQQALFQCGFPEFIGPVLYEVEPARFREVCLRYLKGHPWWILEVLRDAPPGHRASLSREDLAPLLSHSDAELRLEAIRCLFPSGREETAPPALAQPRSSLRRS